MNPDQDLRELPQPSAGQLESQKPEAVILILADIRGYTRYMTPNAKTLAHSQAIITELVETIIQQVDMPLEVAKLEGDAVFLFGRKAVAPEAWAEMRRHIGEWLLTLFNAFAEKLAEWGCSNTCACGPCRNLAQLRLKLIVHSGEALFHRVARFEELAGVDVILVHRLLKNSVPARQYLLLTEAAWRELEFPAEVVWSSGSEHYEDFDHVPTRVHLADGGQPPGAARQWAPSQGRVRAAVWLQLQLWRHSIGPALGWRPKRLAGTNHATAAARSRGFALAMLMLTPLLLPAGLLVAVAHSILVENRASRKEEPCTSTHS
jgi:class 3 adenylate cyclase